MAANTLYLLFPLGHINVILLGWIGYKEINPAPFSTSAGKAMVTEQAFPLSCYCMDWDIPN